MIDYLVNERKIEILLSSPFLIKKEEHKLKETKTRLKYLEKSVLFGAAAEVFIYGLAKRRVKIKLNNSVWHLLDASFAVTCYFMNKEAFFTAAQWTTKDVAHILEEQRTSFACLGLKKLDINEKKTNDNGLNRIFLSTSLAVYCFAGLI